MRKLILLTANIDEQIKTARLINSINSKIINKKNLNDGIRLSFDESELLQDIVVSVKTLKP